MANSEDRDMPPAVSDDMVERAHKALMSELSLICQPDRGDVFGFMDDHPEVLRAALSAALPQPTFPPLTDRMFHAAGVAMRGLSEPEAIIQAVHDAFAKYAPAALPQPVGVDALVSMLERRDADDIPPSREERAFIVKALRTRATTAAQPSAPSINIDAIGMRLYTLENENERLRAELSVLASPSAEAAKPVVLAEWEDPRVQVVYRILCDTETGPPPEEHWEGFLARRIIAALSQPQGGLREALAEQIREKLREWVMSPDFDARDVTTKAIEFSLDAALAGRAAG